MRLLLLLAALPLLLAAAPAEADRGPIRAAVFTDATGVHSASFSYVGSCDGPGTITLTIRRPAGDDVRTVSVSSSAPTGTCGAGLRCYDCPPVPTAYAWTIKGNGVLLVGGGPAAYYQYQDNPLGYALAGAFQEGYLEAAGVL